MENPENIINSICTKYRHEPSVVANSKKVYQSAVKSGLDQKHKSMALAVGALYFYCKSSGKPVTMNQLLEMTPLYREEIDAVYADLKKKNIRY